MSRPRRRTSGRVAGPGLYGEVTDEPCDSDYWSLNDAAEDPNNGVASC